MYQTQRLKFTQKCGILLASGRISLNMANPYRSYMYTIPTLPKTVYRYLQRCEEELGMSQWELIVLAIFILKSAREEPNLEWFEWARKAVKEWK